MSIDEKGEIDWTMSKDYSPTYHESHDEYPKWIPIVITVIIISLVALSILM